MKVAIVIRVPVKLVQGAVRGIMASAAKLSVKLVPERDLGQYRGTVALLINGNVHTYQLPYPGIATDVKVDVKSRCVTVTVQKVSHSVVPALGLGPPIPRHAPLPVPECGPPVSAFMETVYRAALNKMYTSDEWPSEASRPTKALTAPLPGRAGEWHARLLKDVITKLFECTTSRSGAFVVKIQSSGPRGLVAVLFVHRPAVLPPQGKGIGITPVLDVSYVYVPPLSTKAASPAARAAGQKLRKLIEKTENAYSRACEQTFSAINWPGGYSDAVAEYLEYCHTAMVDRSLPDINQFPQTKSGMAKVAPATATAFESLKGELKHALLLSLFPTYFDNCKAKE
ncbi:hypothetical protein H9P43_006719 [Blastocladiella emersonii ATCC 22665]|nr:hypothetical protein H9P43_006694 [Blastocladiella emersonii ATCC 22665]KAI9175358.1 hypothetical protein H9P43_006719 [Blastocladiella emersonii ATCC 22665]